MTPTPTTHAQYPGVPDQDTRPQDLLAYALHWGLGALDGHLLRRLDAIALAQVRSLPKDLSPTDAKVDARMHDLRIRIAQEQHRRTQAWARIAADLAGLETDPNQDQEILDQEAPAAMTDQERACKLLAAALTLIMNQDPGQGGGGRKAPLVPPPPTRPPQGTALRQPQAPTQAPTRTKADDIAF